MYDRRLDAIIAAAQTGSFSQAAKRLHLSVPALAKQVESFEAEHELKLFERSRQGVRLTPVGELFVDDARALIRNANDALRRAHEHASTGGGSVRLGVSLLSPAKKTLDAWPAIRKLEPSLRMELVPIGDIYDEKLGIVRELGKDVDIVQCAYSPERWSGLCQALPIGTAHLTVDVPRKSALAPKDELELADLAGQRVCILKNAARGMDELAERLRAMTDVKVVEVESYTLGLYNECAEAGGCIVTAGAWSGQHPELVTVPLAEAIETPCALLYPLDPSAATQTFVEAYRKLLAADQQSAHDK